MPPPAALSGIAASSDIGMLGGDLYAAKVLSKEQLLIDYEIGEAVGRIVEGIAVDPTTLACEVIERVGPGALFLTDAHTLSWLRQQEHYLGQLFNRFGSRETEDTTVQKAHARVQEILERKQESPVSPAVITRIDAYVNQETHRIRARV